MDKTTTSRNEEDRGKFLITCLCCGSTDVELEAHESGYERGEADAELECQTCKAKWDGEDDAYRGWVKDGPVRLEEDKK